MTDVDLTYLSLGAGVQSGTIAEMIAEGDLPPVDAAVFSDTGDEPQYVYDCVDYLTGRLREVDVPVIKVQKGDIIKDAMHPANRFAAIPVFTIQHDGKIGKMRRQCTREYKIQPIEKWLRGRLLDMGLAKQRVTGAIVATKGVNVECWLGLSLDEIVRMAPNRTKFITNRWPLIEKRMMRYDCVTWLKSHGLPIPKKSSCRICPFHNDRYWRDMRDNHPCDWGHVVKFDAELRSENGKMGRLQATEKGELYLHRQCVPLDRVDLSTPQDHGQLEMFDECDSGYCFV